LKLNKLWNSLSCAGEGIAMTAQSAKTMQAIFERLNSPSAKVVATRVPRNVLRIELFIFVSMNLHISLTDVTLRNVARNRPKRDRNPRHVGMLVT
jgi:hypothetical protein